MLVWKPTEIKMKEKLTKLNKIKSQISLFLKFSDSINLSFWLRLHLRRG